MPPTITIIAAQTKSVIDRATEDNATIERNSGPTVAAAAPRRHRPARLAHKFPDDVSAIDQLTGIVQGWGCRVEVADHALDRHGYMAGRDEDRVADLNAAYADPAVRAIITTRGGAGAYRLLEGLDYGAIRADPKPLVGFSDITYLHLAVWHHCQVQANHTVHHLLTDPEPYVLERNPLLQSAGIESAGRARGFVIGGALAAMAGMVGAGLPDLSGAIVAIEAQRHVGLGHVDRHLTRRSGIRPRPRPTGHPARHGRRTRHRQRNTHIHVNATHTEARDARRAGRACG